ncbi:MAG: dihydroorotate dehydrogenase electron transfer subunit [Gammaproteobacteria bacterium]|nr:dihydroorotate dehydrogenase electron transfer subunit [Gammaproteobacteria bacterium]
MNRSHRGTIFQEQGEVLDHQAWPGNQHILRLHAPKCAETAKPGSFVHIQCDPLLPMRRPLSIMRTSAREGWIDLLYKVEGNGTRNLSTRQKGEKLSLLGPIGTPFQEHMNRPKPLLIGGGVGIPPMIFLADSLRSIVGAYQPLVLMGSEIPFPFKPKPSEIIVPGMPEGIIASMPLLDDWNIPGRLASQQGFAGCYEGYVTDLARYWLESLDESSLKEVEVFSCGPHPMLEAVAKLASEFNLPCQVSLEEFMACAVGGCAGCVVEVQTDQGPAMKRVCVDGPVFDATSIFAT